MDCLGNSRTSFSIPLRLIDNLTQINDRLSASFKMLAGLKADLTLQDDTSDVSETFLGCIICVAQKPHIPRTVSPSTQQPLCSMALSPVGLQNSAIYELNTPSTYFPGWFCNHCESLERNYACLQKHSSRYVAEI